MKHPPTISVDVHQRALYNRLSLCHLIDVQDSQSRVMGHHACANVVATAKHKRAKCLR